MNIEIRSLNQSDIPDADRILSLAFGTPGSRVEDLRRCLSLQPDGWRLALYDGQPVGTVGAVDYGPFAWIGMMAVLPERQHLGIGDRLMINILDWLDARGCPLVRLDATQAGARLYRKHSFVEVGLCHLFFDPKFEPLPQKPYNTAVMQLADLPEVASLDSAIFGAQRERLLQIYWNDLKGRCFIARTEGGDLAGYLVAQSSRIGPWASATPAAAEAMLGTALSLSFDGPLRLIVPSENVQALRMFSRLGFEETNLHLHMVRGRGGHLSTDQGQNDTGKLTPGKRDLIYAQASFALG